MSLPEPILTKVLRVGFRNIRKDPRILNSLFFNLDAQEQMKIRKLILEKSINLSINFPRTGLKSPSIVLLLKNESESQAFIGNIMGTSPNYNTPDSSLTYDDLLGGNSPVTGIGGAVKVLLDNIAVDHSSENSNGSTRIFFTDASQDLVQDFLNEAAGLESMSVYVKDGTGEGEFFDVLRINSNHLDIEGSIDPQLDNTSIIQFTTSSGCEVVGEPQPTFSSTSTNITRTGANYQCQYQLIVLTGSQEETTYLYYVVKAILLSQTAYLEGQGLQALQLSGSDLAPRPEFVPNELFQRALNVNFIYPFSFLEESGVAFSSISVSLGCGLEENCAGDFDINIPL